MRLEAKWQAHQSSSFALDCEFVRSNRGVLYWYTFVGAVSANWCTGAAGGSIQGVKGKIGLMSSEN
jgi:hypothetical protein